MAENVLTQNGTPKEEFLILNKSELEKHLQCMICSKFLNVSPIFYNDSLGSICGRCCGAARDAPGTTSRQHSLELIGKVFTYPCSNKKYGCDSVVTWKDIEGHEKSCSYQCNFCPLHYTQYFETECSWSGNIKELSGHLQASHKNIIIDPPQLNLDIGPEVERRNHIFCTHIGSQLVTVILKHDTGEKYYCLVLFNGNDVESQCYRYQLELFDETKINSLILRKNRLEPAGCIIEALHTPEKMLELDLVKLKDMLGTTKTIHIKFGIVRKHKKEILQITGTNEPEVLKHSVTKESFPVPDDDLLVELECPVCQEYMISPIYVCETGHSVCQTCKARVATCPSCRRVFGGTRNFTLEKLTLRVKYPCKNREIGCCFVSTSDKIKQHESSCELSEVNCILGCGWKGLGPGMYNHLLEKHPADIIQNNEVLMRDTRNDKHTTYHILYVMGQLFRFSIKNGPPVKFNLQHLGMVENEPAFKYQIHFMDQSPLALHLMLSNTCQPITESVGDSLKACVTVPHEWMKNAIFEKRYFYMKLDITKV